MITVTIWGLCAALWTITLWWSSRYRRDRARPRAGFTDYMDGGISPRNVLSAQFYVPEARHVVTVVRVVAVLTPLVAIGTLFAVLFAQALVSQDEVARATSPTGDVDAVLVEVNGGATTDFGYRIDLVPRGERSSRRDAVASLDGAVRNDQAYGVNLRWAAPNHLVGEFLRARTDTVLAPTAIIVGDTVTVSLRAGIEDSTAPPGGMLYNLRRRTP